MDLSSDDVLPDVNPMNVIGAVAVGMPSMSAGASGGNSTSQLGVGVGADRQGQGAVVPFDAPSALVVEVLKELDKDYMSLRSRLVSLIDQQSNVLNMNMNTNMKIGEREPEKGVVHSVALNDMVEKEGDEVKMKEEMKEDGSVSEQDNGATQALVSGTSDTPKDGSRQQVNT